MKKSRLSFARYNPTRRKQRRRQIALASGAGVCALLIGAAMLIPTKYSSHSAQWSIQRPFLEQSETTSGNQPNVPVLQLVSVSPKKRAAQLEAIALESKKSLDRSRARYLLAADLIKQKQGEKALQWLDGLERDYSVLAAHIAFKRAQAYELTGDKEKASEAWQELLQHYSHEPVAAEALYKLSSADPQYWEKAKEYSPRPRVVEIVQRMYAFSPDDPQYWEQALERYPSHPRILELARQRLKENPKQPELMVLLARYAFDTPNITPVLDKLVGNYSEAVGQKKRPIIQPEDWEAIALGYWQDQKYGQASEAYAKAPRTPPNAYRAALGLQYAEKLGEARAAYKQMVQDFPKAEESASALLQLAKIEPDIGVVPYLDQAINQFPNRAGEALLAKAEVLDKLESTKGAAKARQLLLTKYGNSDAAAEYRWQMAQAEAKTGDVEAALEWAEPIITQNPNSEPARQAGFWVGKWARKLGRQQEAKTAFEYVVANYPQSYYAWRSAVHLGWDVGDFNTVRKQAPKVVLPAERPRLPAGSDALQELYKLGQDQDASKLWQAEFQNRLQPTVAEQFTDGLMMLARGDHMEGISKIATLEDRETPQEQAEYQALRQQLPYWHALYPMPFRNIIETESQQHQLNPLLVTALIRQESRFEPEIRSKAGAVGLMQVLPDVGASAARHIKLKQYALSNPNDNVKLGTWLLDETHIVNRNNSLLAVASYNAGQGNLSGWLRQNKPSDPDEFVEAIPYNETRDYVKQVFGNYWNYLRLYDQQVQAELAKYPTAPSIAMRREKAEGF